MGSLRLKRQRPINRRSPAKTYRRLAITNAPQSVRSPSLPALPIESLPARWLYHCSGAPPEITCPHSRPLRTIRPIKTKRLPCRRLVVGINVVDRLFASHFSENI